MGDGITKEAKILNALFEQAAAASSASRRERRESEEFYFNDVQKTKTNFTRKQKNAIAGTYNIPVSTKIVYPIVEQLISILTATKPFPKLLSAEQSTQDFATLYEKAFVGTWYESKANSGNIKVVRDMMNTGEGYFYVRKNDFFNETTFNVLIDYLPWRYVFWDPEAVRDDKTDADFCIVAQVMRADKAERAFDITLSEELGNAYGANSLAILNEVEEDFPMLETDLANYGKKKKYVFIRTCFRKEEINVYVSDKGEVSNKRPKTVMIPNPDKAELAQKLMEMGGMVSQQTDDANQADAVAGEIEDAPEMAASTQGYQEGSQAALETRQKADGMAEQQAEMQAQMQEMQLMLAKLPDRVPAYRMKLMNGDTVTAMNVTKIKKRWVRRQVMVDNTIVEDEYLPLDRYPVIPFTFMQKGNPNAIYGLVHFLKDVVKAMNKFLSELILHVQLSASFKVLYPEGSIVDPAKFEQQFSVPGATLSYKSDPSLQDGGKPTIVSPPAVNQALTYLMDKLVWLVEYISGINGLIQGDPSAAPNTFGATQAMQTFGTQRAKLYSRNIENCYEELAYVAVQYLQAYAPRDKVLQFFDDNGDAQEVQILNNNEDLRFKVRCEIITSLPVTKQIAAQALGMIAQTAGDPKLASLLSQFMLETIDLPQGREWAKQIDLINQMSQQLQQSEQTIEALQNQMKSMQNNYAEKEIAHNIAQETEKAKTGVAVEAARQEEQIKAQGQDTRGQELPDINPDIPF